MKSKSINSFLAFAVCTVFALPVSASLVHMDTTMGVIEIELFDEVAPVTVANFMNYVNDGDYINTVFHRSVPGFILQGGGFTYDNVNGYGYVPADAPIVNEFNLSNTRGTLAMAKLGGDPDSATSQWFFNLADNSANLDYQNGGFTVFGQVISGMDVVDAIASLQAWDLSTIVHSAWANVPLNGYVYPQAYDPDQHLVKVNQISAVPVPAAIWFFLSGLLGLVGVARKNAT